jgi:hypothetical protein
VHFGQLYSVGSCHLTLSLQGVILLSGSLTATINQSLAVIACPIEHLQLLIIAAL